MCVAHPPHAQRILVDAIATGMLQRVLSVMLSARRRQDRLEGMETDTIHTVGM